MPESDLDHVFMTTISRDKFEAVVKKSCRGPFVIELQGSDPTIIPQPRLFCVKFATPEDRDRVRIAMRFVEKEQAAVDARTKPSAPARPAAARTAAAAI